MSDTAAGTYEIRWAEDKDWIPAMHMIWKTFLKFEAGGLYRGGNP